MDDLKKIKKHYGESMMKLCRENFPRILETEGLLFKILEENFFQYRNLAKDIINQGLEEEFKLFIYSKVDVEENEVEIEETLTAKQLLEKAGYELYPECKSEKDIQSFRHYYSSGEELCTFRGGRLHSCRVWFAIKKDVDKIKRENFKKPTRQDEYGTSVISIQFTKGKYSTLSIKNRYNHTVNNPDNTFNSNLDNIVEGLSDAFAKDYGVRDFVNNKYSFELDGYVVAGDRKYYPYNYEINNIYYCPNNIVIDNFMVKQLPPHQMLIDYFVVDCKENTIKLYDESVNDSFSYVFQKCNKINIKDGVITIVNKDGKEAIIKINDKREIVYLEDRNLSKCGHKFLYNNKELREVCLPNLKQCGDKFLCRNKELRELSFPELTQCGDNFVSFNKKIKELSLPKLTECGVSFLYHNEELTKLDLEKLIYCDDHFLHANRELSELNLPNLIKTGSAFLEQNEKLRALSLPSLKECHNLFLYRNEVISKLNLPELTECGSDFLYHNQALGELNLPKLTKCGNKFLGNNKILNEISLPELTKRGDDFLSLNEDAKKALEELKDSISCFYYEKDRNSKR